VTSDDAIKLRACHGLQAAAIFRVQSRLDCRRGWFTLCIRDRGEAISWMWNRLSAYK